MKSDNSNSGHKKVLILGSGCGGILAILIAIIAFFKGCGASFGLFTNGSNSNSNSDTGSSYSQENSETIQETVINTNATETYEESVTSIEVTVSGSEYIFDNSTIGLDDLINELKDIDGKFIVAIKDDNSSKKAYDALKTKLEMNNISYAEE